jgi:hypothetical protein
MTMPILAHTIHSSPLSDNVITICYEKEWFIYEISKYFREQQIFSKMFGHISMIHASVLIKELNLLITADDLGIIRSWDLHTQKAIQSTKLKGSKNINRMFSMGRIGFMVFTSNIEFFRFEGESNQYIRVDDRSLPKRQRMGEYKQFGVIPRIKFCKLKDGIMQFYVSTAKEVRSFNLDNGLLTWRYSKEKFKLNMNNRLVTCFHPTKSPIPGLFIGLNDGHIMFLPEKSESMSEHVHIKVMLKKIRKKIVDFGGGRGIKVITQKVKERHTNYGENGDFRSQNSIIGFIKNEKTHSLLAYTNLKIVLINVKFEYEPGSLRRLEIRLGGKQNFMPEVGQGEMTISEIHQT